MTRGKEKKKKLCKQLDWDVVTYYVGADGTEGIGATHIEMSAIQPQKNLDVIEAISLDGNKSAVSGP